MTCWSFGVLIPIIAAFAEWLNVLMQQCLTSQSLKWFSTHLCKAPDECRCTTLVVFLMHVTSSHLWVDLGPESLLLEAIRKLKWGRWAAEHKQHLKLIGWGRVSFISRKYRDNEDAYSILHVWKSEQNKPCFAFDVENGQMEEQSFNEELWAVFEY